MKKTIRYQVRYLCSGLLHLAFALLGFPLYLLCSFFDYGHEAINGDEIREEAQG